MKANIYDIKGKDTGKTIELEDSVFAIEPNDHAIYLDVKQYLANNRQGTSKSKERSEIVGSTRKIKRQKGTGTARAGSIKSPVFRGGGRAFGPKPRNYYFKLNKKIKRLARKSAISYKIKNEGIIISENIDFKDIKTKNIVELLNNFKISDKKLTIVLPEQNKSVYLSSRNLQGVKTVLASELNTYEVMWAEKLLITESSIDILRRIL